MTLCKYNNHDYKKFNDKGKVFVPADEPWDRYGVCVKCGHNVSGDKEPGKC